jgi:hypothetical protein
MPPSRSNPPVRGPGGTRAPDSSVSFHPFIFVNSTHPHPDPSLHPYPPGGRAARQNGPSWPLAWRGRLPAGPVFLPNPPGCRRDPTHRCAAARLRAGLARGAGGSQGQDGRPAPAPRRLPRSAVPHVFPPPFPLFFRYLFVFRPGEFLFISRLPPIVKLISSLFHPGCAVPLTARRPLIAPEVRVALATGPTGVAPSQQGRPSCAARRARNGRDFPG